MALKTYGIWYVHNDSFLKNILDRELNDDLYGKQRQFVHGAFLCPTKNYQRRPHSTFTNINRQKNKKIDVNITLLISTSLKFGIIVHI